MDDALSQQLAQPTRAGVTTSIIEEGWADKESRHFGSWRRRWLVLFRDGRSQLPYICTFKTPRSGWEPTEPPPRPTEKLLLVGATCMIVAPRGPGRDHVFWLRTRDGDFFFSTESGDQSRRWVRAVSKCSAEAALRIGGVNEDLPVAFATGGYAQHSPLMCARPPAKHTPMPGQPPAGTRAREHASCTGGVCAALHATPRASATQ